MSLLCCFSAILSLLPSFITEHPKNESIEQCAPASLSLKININEIFSLDACHLEQLKYLAENIGDYRCQLLDEVIKKTNALAYKLQVNYHQEEDLKCLLETLCQTVLSFVDYGTIDLTQKVLKENFVGLSKYRKDLSSIKIFVFHTLEHKQELCFDAFLSLENAETILPIIAAVNEAFRDSDLNKDEKESLLLPFFEVYFLAYMVFGHMDEYFLTTYQQKKAQKNSSKSATTGTRQGYIEAIVSHELYRKKVTNPYAKTILKVLRVDPNSIHHQGQNKVFEVEEYFEPACQKSARKILKVDN